MIKIWDSATKNSRKLRHEHKASVSAMAFSSDGQLLASGSTDGSVRLWDLAVEDGAPRTLDLNGGPPPASPTPGPTKLPLGAQSPNLCQKPYPSRGGSYLDNPIRCPQLDRCGLVHVAPKAHLFYSCPDVPFSHRFRPCRSKSPSRESNLLSRCHRSRCSKPAKNLLNGFRSGPRAEEENNALV
jgi:hypothetical protein